MFDMKNPAIRIAEKTNYLNKDISYLKNISITEYDIKSAGFSVIKFLKLLPAEEIARLENLSKYERNVAIGLYIKRTPSIGEKIQNTLISVRQAFVAINEIDAHSILSIKKDAIFVIKQKPTILNIKNFFTFVKKNTYTSYSLLNGKEFYFNSNGNILDIKGLSKEALDLTEEPKTILKTIFSQAEKIAPENLFPIFQKFSKKYLSYELETEKYRELETGHFRVGQFLFENITEELKKDLDVSQSYIKYYLPLMQNII